MLEFAPAYATLPPNNSLLCGLSFKHRVSIRVYCYGPYLTFGFVNTPALYSTVTRIDVGDEKLL